MPNPPAIALSKKQKIVLYELYGGNSVTLRNRANIVLLANWGYANSEITEKTTLSLSLVTKWTDYYIQAQETLYKIEKETPKQLRKAIIDILSDASVRKKGYQLNATFMSEQINAIIDVYCEKKDYPVSDLRKEIINRGIVDTISLGQLNSMLTLYMSRIVDLKHEKYKRGISI